MKDCFNENKQLNSLSPFKRMSEEQRKEMMSYVRKDKNRVDWIAIIEDFLYDTVHRIVLIVLYVAFFIFLCKCFFEAI